METLFDALDQETVDVNRKDFRKPPFNYPGGKSRSLQFILPKLPYKKAYVEPFCGSAAVLIARDPVKLEVINDKYRGVTEFYRCLRNPALYERLINFLELCVHSREDFESFKRSWESESDPVARAGKWYYVTQFSFGALGRNLGRATRPTTAIVNKISSRLPYFHEIHRRLKNVQVENLDWRHMFADYDSPDTLFYIDPPYLTVHRGTYKSEMSVDDHRELLETIFKCEGACAVSGYDNELYNEYDWDEEHSWESFVSISACSFTEN
jgi:DNA adenine methylase